MNAVSAGFGPFAPGSHPRVSKRTSGPAIAKASSRRRRAGHVGGGSVRGMARKDRRARRDALRLSPPRARGGDCSVAEPAPWSNDSNVAIAVARSGTAITRMRSCEPWRVGPRSWPKGPPPRRGRSLPPCARCGRAGWSTRVRRSRLKRSRRRGCRFDGSRSTGSTGCVAPSPTGDGTCGGEERTLPIRPFPQRGDGPHRLLPLSAGYRYAHDARSVGTSRLPTSIESLWSRRITPRVAMTS
jgi:hypothetical protein